MKKHILCLSFLLLPFSAFCQATKDQNEFLFGVGFESDYKILSQSFNTDPSRYTSSGVFNFSYRHYSRKKFTIGVNVAYEHLKNADRYSEILDQEKFINFSVEVSRSYIDKPIGRRKTLIRTYWLAALGGTIIKETQMGASPETGILPLGIQITPFGIRIGTDIAGFAEFGLGYKGLVNIGLSYRSPKHKTTSVITTTAPEIKEKDE